MRKTRLIAGLAAVVATAALAGPASAANSNSLVVGTVGTELSLAVGAPAAMTFTHSTPGTASSLVTVTSTNPTWTLSIKDGGNGAADTTLGRMDRCTVDTSVVPPVVTAIANPLVSLTNPLQWNVDNGAYSNLSGSDATVRAGALVEAHTVGFQQSLAAAEDVPSGTVYCANVAYTVN